MIERTRKLITTANQHMILLFINILEIFKFIAHLKRTPKYSLKMTQNMSKWIQNITEITHTHTRTHNYKYMQITKEYEANTQRTSPN